MPAETPPTRTIFLMTTCAIAIAAIIGAVAGVYLGRHYRPRPAPVRIARGPSTPGQPPSGLPSPPPPATVPESGAPGAAPSTPGAPVNPSASPAHPAAPKVPSAHLKTGGAVAPKPVPKTGSPAPGERRALTPLRVPVRPRHPAVAREIGTVGGGAVRRPPARLANGRTPSRVRMKVENWRERRSAAVARIPHRARVAQAPRQRLRVTGMMPPVRPLPAPRWKRQQRVARMLATAPPHPSRRTRRRRSRRELIAAAPARLVPIKPQPTAVLPQPTPIATSVPAPPAHPISPALRSRLLRQAAERVRYIQQPVVLDGRPATLSTYIVWDRGQPRTFSFVRQGVRTDLARIVSVDEAARRVRVLVPDRGALIEATVPTATVVVYGQAVQMNPPPAEEIARANALAGAGIIAGPTLPGPAVAAVPPVERVAGMRQTMPEVVGRVRSVDPATRRIVLSGPRRKTPFRAAAGVLLPQVGQVIAITTTDEPISPRPALGVTVLQPTVAGVVTMVRPIAVELHVRTVAPDGQVEEIPVPVAGDARVFINGQPGDLRALKQGVYIRAFMTPTGEARILGPPSE